MSDAAVNRVSRIGSVVGRVMVCRRCWRSVDVIEAALGANTEEEHRWLDESAYVCGLCLDPEPLALGEQAEPSTQAGEALGRARMAQERGYVMKRAIEEIEAAS